MTRRGWFLWIAWGVGWVIYDAIYAVVMFSQGRVGMGLLYCLAILVMMGLYAWLLRRTPLPPKKELTDSK